MRIFFKILILCSIAISPVFSQNQTSPAIQVLAKPKDDAIHLRWVTDNPNLWQTGNKYGYTVIRKTIKKDNKFYKKGINEVKFSITPYNQKQWNDLVQTVDYAKLIIGYFYEDPIVSTDTAVVNNALKGRMALCLLASDLSPEVAKGLALSFKDTTVKANETYIYQVALNKQSNIASNTIGQIVSSLENAYPSFPPDNLIDLDFVNHRTILKWTLPTRSVYSAYNIERSDDNGVNYLKINNLPYYPVGNSADENFGTYSDSVATLQKTYKYRVRGIDPFADLSAPSNVVSVYAYETNLVGGQNIQYEFPDQSTVNLVWDYPDSLKVNIKGFDIYKTNGSAEPVKVNTRLMDSPILSYKAKLNPLDEILYFFVDAIDLRGKTYRSNPVSVTIIDSIPPVQVQTLGGEITKNGITKICWDKNKDLDLYGYEVFRAEGYSRENMFLVKRVNKTDNFLIDTLDMGMKNPKVHYLLYAMDNHSNLSVHSDTLTLIRPDVFPPEPPSFSNAYLSDSSLVIEWTPSTSFDVTKYKLYRQSLPDTTKQEVLAFEMSNYQHYYSDEQYVEGRENVYILEAFDGSELSSGDGCKRTVKVPKPIRRPPVEKIQGEYSRKEKQTTISWEYKSRTPIKEFWIFRKSEKENTFSKIATVEADKTEFIDKSPPEKQTVSYQVFAICSDKTRSGEGKAFDIKTK